LGILRHHQVNFSCVNRVELDRQHLADVDLMVAVGGDGTVLSAAHFLDHGTIPLLGINSDPMKTTEELSVKKKSDERRSHGALCMCTAVDMKEGVAKVLHGGARLGSRTRIHCSVKSTFSETRLVPALNDLLIANPSPAAVSRFRMGWLDPVNEETLLAQQANGAEATSTTEEFQHHHFKSTLYGTTCRFGGQAYEVQNSLNVWSSGMWVCTATGSTAAMAAAGGKYMELESKRLQYLIREHMIENSENREALRKLDNGFLTEGEKMHLRWNSQKGRIFIDGSHLTHNLDLGDEILIDNKAPPLKLYMKSDV
jgi:NAD+ kinase